MSEPALRAGDADRDRVAVALRDHLVAGRLTLDEFVERIELAHEAKTLGELEELQRDLPATGDTAVRAPSPGRLSRSPQRWLIAIMAGTHRKRRWRLAARTNVLTIMGGAHLDLRQAELESTESQITIVSVMGGCDVIVPEGIDVEVVGIAFMGGKNVRLSDARPLAGAPYIRIRVLAVMGGVSVRSRGALRADSLAAPPPLPPLPR
jgi:hypothetical protein